MGSGAGRGGASSSHVPKPCPLSAEGQHGAGWPASPQPRLQATPTPGHHLCPGQVPASGVARNGGWRLQTARHTVVWVVPGQAVCCLQGRLSTSGLQSPEGRCRPAESRVGSPGDAASSHRDIRGSLLASDGCQNVTPEPPASAAPTPRGHLRERGLPDLNGVLQQGRVRRQLEVRPTAMTAPHPPGCPSQR